MSTPQLTRAAVEAWIGWTADDDDAGSITATLWLVDHVPYQHDGGVSGDDLASIMLSELAVLEDSP